MLREIPLELFSESDYAAANPDVAAAIASGELESGWVHYLIHGAREDRPGVAPDLHRSLSGYLQDLPPLPMPPAHLRERVHGSPDAFSFGLVGLMGTLDLYRVLRAAHVPLGIGQVLDFGSGCGRVTRCFRGLGDRLHIVGTDIDPEAIAWSRSNLPDLGEFLVNPARPPLPFPERSFDLVYSVSVFTHLPEDMQLDWLAELTRVTRPGGYQVHSIHGEPLADGLSSTDRRRLRENGFVYVRGGGTVGLPDFYQTAFHTEAYIRSRWSAYVDVVAIYPRGMAGHQDLVVLRRRP